MKDECHDLRLPPPGKGLSKAISWRTFFDVLHGRFFLKGRKGVGRRVEQGDAALVALSQLVPANDPNGLKAESNIDEAVRRLVEAKHISTDAQKNEASVKLQRAAGVLDADVLCMVVRTSGRNEVDNAIDIFQRLNSGGTKLVAGNVQAARFAQETTVTILDPMRDFAREESCRAWALTLPS